MANESESFTIYAFDIKRRSNPSAAFRELFDGVKSALGNNRELAKAAALFRGGVVVTREDADRIAALEKAGIAASEFAIGSLPPATGPGLALMYDAALEALRTSDRRIRLDRFNPRAVTVLMHSVESVMQRIGSLSVSALEMALQDQRFRDHLRDRAASLGAMGIWTLALDNPLDECEYCEIVVHQGSGLPSHRRCGLKEECDSIFGFLIVVLVGMLVVGLLEWLFDW